MILSTSRHVPTDFANDLRPTAQVVPFVPADGRRFRQDAAGSAEPCGKILLFTGVRYERMPEAASEAAVPQRRRS